MTSTLFPVRLVGTEPKPLRDYQARCVQLTAKAVITQPHRGYHYVLPTGTGKTRIARSLCGSFAEFYKGRGLVVAHRKELIEQMAAELRLQLDNVGIVMAERNDCFANVVVGSIQTLQQKRLRQLLEIGQFDWCFIDECHHVTPKNSYNTLLQALWQHNPQLKVIGCTATDFRADGESFQELLPVCTFTRDIATMQDAGWLAPTIWHPLELPLDFDAIKTCVREGQTDYYGEQVGALLQDHARTIAALTCKELAQRPTVVFCASVSQAQEQTRAYLRLGVTAACVTGDMLMYERDRLISMWKHGTIQVMCNVGIFTEGFDYTPLLPNREGLAAVVIARPTMSPGLYLQMLGRGTRLKPGTYRDCLVVDVCGNANLLESKQITLPRVMPSMPDVTSTSELVEAMRKEKEDEKKKPRSLRIGSFEAVAWFATGYDALTSSYYLGMGDNNHYVSLIPARNGSGLFEVLLFTRFPQWHTNHIAGPIKLNQCAQHVNLLLAKSGRKNLLAKESAWRSHRASDKALLTLRQLDSEQASRATEEGWTKGEVGFAIDWAVIGPEVRRMAV